MPVTIRHKKKQDDGSYVVVSKEYITVHERVTELHKQRNGTAVQIETWIAGEDEKSITLGAKVTTPAGTFTGHARSSKTVSSIEGQSPLEVAETSAVGRALGFAGIGITEGIATADEVKAAQQPPKPKRPIPADADHGQRPLKKQEEVDPRTAAIRAVYGAAQDKGWDEGEVKFFLKTDSLDALAAHMTSGEECKCGKPHNLKDEIAAYRVMTSLVKAAK